MTPLIQLKRTAALLLIVLTLTCLVLPGRVQALAPPPDGGYPGGNTAEGTGALDHLVVPRRGFEGGEGNTALGFQALGNLTTSDSNTATGHQALFSNTSGSTNTAVGVAALNANTTGGANVAIGVQALLSNNNGSRNTAVGNVALGFNSAGSGNTAVGEGALATATGDGNTALGQSAGGLGFLTGSFNTAIGTSALEFSAGGDGNTAVGYRALEFSTASGQFCFPNTAVGSRALGESIDGCSNTAVGGSALGSNTSGSGNVAVGLLAGNNVTTANNVICVGTTVGGANVSNSCYIGNIFGQSSTSGTAVFVNADGKLGTSTSSRRFKDGIKPMDHASEALFALKPVSFRYKKDVDPQGISQLGLVAEDVEKVNPDLVVRDKDGKAYSVRYDQVNAMLLNEFLKARRQIDAQQKQIDALTAGLQKVSAQVEASQTAPQMVNNNR